MLPKYTRRVVTALALVVAFAGGIVLDRAVVNRDCKTRPDIPVQADVRGQALRYPVEVTLHRFKIQDGQSRRFTQWITFLHEQHQPAVDSLERERTYFEAMFTDPDDPSDLLWVVAKGEGGAPVESSKLAIDVQHEAYMKDVLVRGSHRQLETQNVLMPVFVTDAIAAHQASEPKPEVSTSSGQ